MKNKFSFVKLCFTFTKLFNSYVCDPTILTNNDKLVDECLEFLSSWGTKGPVSGASPQSWFLNSHLNATLQDNGNANEDEDSDSSSSEDEAHTERPFQPPPFRSQGNIPFTRSVCIFNVELFSTLSVGYVFEYKDNDHGIPFRPYKMFEFRNTGMQVPMKKKISRKRELLKLAYGADIQLKGLSCFVKSRRFKFAGFCSRFAGRRRQSIALV